jgi:hypothetical protein
MNAGDLQEVLDQTISDLDIFVCRVYESEQGRHPLLCSAKVSDKYYVSCGRRKPGKGQRCRDCKAGASKLKAHIRYITEEPCSHCGLPLGNQHTGSICFCCSRYGISTKTLLNSKLWNGCCEICGVTETPEKKFYIDHDHLSSACSHPSIRTGCAACVRGVLCNSCNTKIGGMFEEMSQMIFDHFKLDAMQFAVLHYSYVKADLDWTSKAYSYLTSGKRYPKSIFQEKS